MTAAIGEYFRSPGGRNTLQIIGTLLVGGSLTTLSAIGMAHETSQARAASSGVRSIEDQSGIYLSEMNPTDTQYGSVTQLDQSSDIHYARANILVWTTLGLGSLTALGAMSIGIGYREEKLQSE